jgi:hypothetical protein
VAHQKWQVRVLLDIFGMAVVDSFLLARKFMPRCQNADSDDGVFWRYVTTLLPQVATEYNTNGPTVSQYKCEQVLIGKSKVTSRKNTGRVVAKQQRCAYCIKSKKLKKKQAKIQHPPTVAHLIELGELPIPVSVIAMLLPARRGWGGVG